MQMKLDSKEYIKYDDKVDKSKNFKYVVELLTIIQERFAQGAINRFDKALKLSNTELVTCFNLIQQYDEIARAQVQKGGVSELVALMKDVTYGNCEIIASYAQGYMLSKHPTISAEMMYLDNHAILVLGRGRGFKNKANDIKSWGNDVIICDFWAENIYLSTNFFKIREKAPNVSFCLKAIDAKTGVIKQIIESKDHYLKGTPKISTGELSDKYDKMFAKWVVEDLNIRSAQQVVSVVEKMPSTFSIFKKPIPQKLLHKYELPNDEQAHLEKGLRRAAANNNLVDLKLFIEYVKDINAQDANPTSKKTALHWAAEKKHIDCYTLLLEFGAKEDICDANGLNASIAHLSVQQM